MDTDKKYYDPQQYNLGMRYEVETNKSSYAIANKKVCSNLKKNPSYYTDLHLAGYDEKKLKSNQAPKSDQYKEINRLPKLNENLLRKRIQRIIKEIKPWNY